MSEINKEKITNPAAPEKKLLDWREDIDRKLVKESQNYNLDDIY